MSIPEAATKVAVHGISLGGEIFETGFWMAVRVVDAADANGTASVVRDHWVTHMATVARNLITSDASWTGLRVYSGWDPDGHATAVGASDFTSPEVGNGGDYSILTQSMVATLTTDFAGRSYRGRMYFPAYGASIGHNHQFDTSTPQDLTTALGAFFSAINGDGALGPVSVVSKFLGLATAVTHVKVDSKPDTQRRRENKLAPESSHTANVTP